MTFHVLKTDQPHFADLIEGRATTQLRLNDRGYHDGDTVTLRERDPRTGQYTGRTATYTISHTTHNPHRFWSWEQIHRHGLTAITLSPPTVAYSDLNAFRAAEGSRVEHGRPTTSPLEDDRP